MSEINKPESMKIEELRSKRKDSIQNAIELDIENDQHLRGILTEDERFHQFYVYKSILGKGAFGKVLEVLDKETRRIIAVKVIEKGLVKEDDLYKLKKEAEILKSLSHPNIVKFIHLKESENRIFLAMEKLSGGSLKALIDAKTKGIYPTKGRKLKDSETSTIMKGLLMGVEYIHSLDIVHRDLKPENILFGRKNDLSSVKIADFGLSAKFTQTPDADQGEHCGTVIYMAPEIGGSKNGYTRSVDLWSVGIILYMLLSGEHPLWKPKDNAKDYIHKLTSKTHNWFFPEGFSRLAQSLFLKLVKVEALERYNATQALNHPWVTRLTTAIPLTIMESLSRYKAADIFKKVSRVLLMLSITRPHKNINVTIPYTQLLDKVSNCIEQWSQLHEKKLFTNDDDFYELEENSPTNFENYGQKTEWEEISTISRARSGENTPASLYNSEGSAKESNARGSCLLNNANSSFTGVMKYENTRMSEGCAADKRSIIHLVEMQKPHQGKGLEIEGRSAQISHKNSHKPRSFRKSSFHNDDEWSFIDYDQNSPHKEGLNNSVIGTNTHSYSPPPQRFLLSNKNSRKSIDKKSADVQQLTNRKTKMHQQNLTSDNFFRRSFDYGAISSQASPNPQTTGASPSFILPSVTKSRATTAHYKGPGGLGNILKRVDRYSHTKHHSLYQKNMMKDISLDTPANNSFSRATDISSNSYSPGLRRKTNRSEFQGKGKNLGVEGKGKEVIRKISPKVSTTDISGKYATTGESISYSVQSYVVQHKNEITLFSTKKKKKRTSIDYGAPSYQVQKVAPERISSKYDKKAINKLTYFAPGEGASNSSSPIRKNRPRSPRLPSGSFSKMNYSKQGNHDISLNFSHIQTLHEQTDLLARVPVKAFLQLNKKQQIQYPQISKWATCRI